jgi:hypothetical protein
MWKKIIRLSTAGYVLSFLCSLCSLLWALKGDYVLSATMGLIAGLLYCCATDSRKGGL